MDRNLALEVVRVTEAAALSSARLMGRGDKEGADGAAVEAMRKAFDTVHICGEVVIGEGELDEAPMLYIGEEVGTGRGPVVDIAVDPLEGTNLCATGGPNAMAGVAMAEAGCLLRAPDTYMEKIAVGPAAAGVIDLSLSPTDNLRRVADAKGVYIDDLTVCILDRERHADLVKEVREAGARIKLIGDGDVAGAIATCFDDSGVDVLMGVWNLEVGTFEARHCSECGLSANVLWRYSKSNRGVVYLCRRCKPIVFDRSFGEVDAMKCAWTSHFESNRRRH